MTDHIPQTSIHRPTAEFREYLDWELSRAFGHARIIRRLRLAAAILVSVAIGTTGGLASAQIREGSQRDSLLEAARADASLVSVRLNLARAELAEARRMVAVGARPGESVAVAETQVREMESELARVALNMEEITATAKAPRDELNAPPVNGRDFATERIQLRLMVAQQHLRMAERVRLETESRVRVGAVSKLTGIEAELDAMRAQHEMVVLAERAALRREFLEKATPVDQLVRRLERAELRQDLTIARRALDLARERAATLEDRHKVGAAGELDVMKAKVDVKEREIELQRLTRRVGDLDRPPGESVP